ncbi:hypothetical protein QTP86_015465 [Hemibagrus guttatus]|nr:hypothetical protein QTP86_015465 [Hemibagrus guttatus]
MAVSGREFETLVDIPAHVWRGLPDGLKLAPSAVNPNRIGVWASCPIPKGKRFGPFAGEKKKRSQVTSNVYMWEVYFPTRGWMCVDATDPMKGNWLRYVNWACSPEEQNLFPLEINRAIYYKVLRPIAQDEELLVWYNGEDNPEIAAALEEERSSNFHKKNSPKAKRARKKLLEKARQAGLGILSGHTALSTRPTVTEMRDSDKEFAFLCNLQQHQTDLHPGQSHAHTMVENGKLRPQNYTDPTQVNMERKYLHLIPDTTVDVAPQDPCGLLNCSSVKEEDDGDNQEDPTEELYTTIKIMASEAGKPKCPDVRLGINQHYPSFKPPPFPYHNRTPADSVVSATNFTTHNIPQTFSTAIRCTKCGNSFDNMPELHKHILACANASDKRRYTPKKNPIPLRQIVNQPQISVFSPITAASAGQNAFRRMGQPKRLNFNQEVPTTIKMSALNKKKNQLVQKAISQKNKAATSVKKTSTQEEQQDGQACPYCSREFTYAASLAKHIACSCPQKPVAKKKKGALMPQNKNMKLRSRTSDSEIKQEGNLCLAVKSLGKTRTRSSELLEGEVTSGSNGKTGTLQIRVKRPALNKHYLAPKSKKDRKSKPEPSVMTSSPTLASQPAAKMQRGGKDMALKKEAETKPQVQPKKEKRFSKRMRERVGGPMTRSLQMASATPPGEVKTEDPPISEPVHEEYKVPRKEDIKLVPRWNCLLDSF